MRNGKRRVMLFEATRSIIDKRSEAIQSQARFTWSRGCCMRLMASCARLRKVHER